MSQTYKKSGIKVLIVDDESDARFIIATLLDTVCPDAVHKFASTAQQAYQALQTNKFDLILSDIEMPQYSGLQFVTELRTKGDQTPVVFITAYDKFTYAQQAVRLNAIDFLLKPLSEKQLAEIIARVRTSTVKTDYTGDLATPSKIVSLKAVNSIVIYKFDDILYLQADGAYSTLFSITGKEEMILEALSALELRLDPAIFIRAGRKHLINISHLRKIDLKTKFITFVVNGEELVLNVSEKGFQQIKKALNDQTLF
jgi:two-component system, LytTR family, response regulator